MTHTSIDDLLAATVERGDVPGVVAIAVNRDGVLYEGASGKARVAEDVGMSVDSIFRIASMTKAITSVAALQLVERGVLSLDAPAGDVLPELANLDVLTESAECRPAERPVTLRHLLSHTSGFGYPFASPALGAYQAAKGSTNPAAGSDLRAPLLFEPGERWQYGTSTDWAGRMVEAASGQSLDAYMREHIFVPLGMNDTGFHVPESRGHRVVTTHARAADGSLTEQPFALPGIPRTFSGGGGLLSTAPDYAQFMRLILNEGELNGTRVFGPGAMECLTTNQCGEAVAGSWVTGAPAFSNDTDFSMGGTARHSLGFVLSTKDSPAGRAAGSLSWGGIYNTYYWIDPARGVAGATFAQLLPFSDAKSLALFDAFESEVYQVFA